MSYCMHPDPFSTYNDATSDRQGSIIQSNTTNAAYIHLVLVKQDSIHLQNVN